MLRYWVGSLGTKLTNQNFRWKQMMVTFSIKEPMTWKSANNSSTAMFETNKVGTKLRTSHRYVFFPKKKLKITKRCPTYQKIYLHPDISCLPPSRSNRRMTYIRAGGECSQKKWVGVCGPLSKTLTLFKTKICDFSYPVNDLTKNLIPY